MIDICRMLAFYGTMQETEYLRTSLTIDRSHEFHLGVLDNAIH